MNEFDWIDRYLKPLATDPAALGLTDDAAFIREPNSIVVSADAFAEHIHFLPTLAPKKLAQRLLATNLSDMAAMAARPRYYTLTGCLPAAPSEDWAREFCAGLADMHDHYGIALLGGDTTSSSGDISFSVTMIGETDTPMRRNTAQAGDDIWVSGCIGEAYLGLQMALETLAGGDPAWLVAYETPTAQTTLGMALNKAGIRCAMDISDGLIADLGHICRASHVHASLQLEYIPLPTTDINPLALISGGDDYQLLFTAPPTMADHINDIATTLNTPLTRIGTILPHNETDKPIHLTEYGQEIPLTAAGFTHF